MTTDSKYNNANPQYFCLTVEKVILLSCRCLHPGHIPAHSGARCPVTDEDIFTNLSINNNCGEAELSGDTWPGCCLDIGVNITIRSTQILFFSIDLALGNHELNVYSIYTLET